jgi:hypothetical protein
MRYGDKHYKKLDGRSKKYLWKLNREPDFFYPVRRTNIRTWTSKNPSSML